MPAIFVLTNNESHQKYVDAITLNASRLANGSRNETLSQKIAYPLFRLVHANILAKDNVDHFVINAGASHGLPYKECMNIIKSAYNKAALDPNSLQSGNHFNESFQHVKENAKNESESKRIGSINKYNKFSPCSKPENGYLVDKQIDDKYDFFKEDRNNLFYPLSSFIDKKIEVVGYGSISKTNYDDKKNSSGCGSKGTYFSFVKGDTKIIYVTEGISDALTINLNTCSTAFSAQGAGNITKVCDEIKAIKPKAEIIGVVDRDKAGDEEKEKLLNSGYKVFQIDIDGFKDINEYHASLNPEIRREKISELLKKTLIKETENDNEILLSRYYLDTSNLTLKDHSDLWIVELAKQIAKITNYPENSAILMGLSILSSVLSLNYKVVSDYRLGAMSIGLFTLHSQPSGADKTPTISLFTNIVDKIEYEILREIKAAEEDVDNSNKDDEEKGFEEGKLDNFSNFKLFHSGGTAEGVMSRQCALQSGFFSLVIDESNQFNMLTGNLYQKGKSDNSLFTKGYQGSKGGSSIKTDNNHSNAHFRIHGSITLSVQESGLNSFVSSDLSDGVQARFLMLRESPIAYEDCQPFNASNNQLFLSSKVMKNYQSVIRQMLAKVYSRQSLNFHDLEEVVFSLEAQDYFGKFIHQIIEKEKRNPDCPEAKRIFLGKAKGAITKVAGVIYLSECLAYDEEIKSIPLDVLKKAINIVMPLVLNSAALAVSATMENEEDYDYIIGLIERSGKSGKTVKQINNNIKHKTSLFSNYMGKTNKKLIDRRNAILKKGVELGDLKVLNNRYYAARHFC